MIDKKDKVALTNGKKIQWVRTADIPAWNNAGYFEKQVDKEPVVKKPSKIKVQDIKEKE